MKTIKNLLLITILLVSCNLQGQVRNYLEYKLIPIPTYPHDEPIQVFYKDEKPTRPYFKLVILEKNIERSYGTFADLIKGLQKQAQDIGVDAIIVDKMGTSVRSSTDAEGYQISINVKEVIVFGIKYKDNLDYLTTIPKEISIYEVADSNAKMVNVGTYSQGLNQEIIIANENSILYKLFYPYSLNHLLYEKHEWKSIVRYNLIRERQLLNFQGTKIKTANFFYDENNNIKTINIRKAGKVSKNYKQVNQNKAAHLRQKNKKFISKKVVFDYNDNGTIHIKKNYPNSTNLNIYYEEVFKYDGKNRIREKQVFKINNDKRTELGKFVFESYYTVEEVKEQFPELQD